MRIFSDGAEYGDTLFWDVNNNVGVAASTRGGAYAYERSSNYTSAKHLLPASLSEAYARLATKHASGASYSVMAFLKDGTTLIDLTYGASAPSFSRMELAIGGVAVAYTTHTYFNSDWHLIEMHVKIDDAPNGIVEVVIDGIPEISFTGDTKPGADADFNYFGVNLNYGYVMIDDIALNDTSNADGKNDNSWCGDEHYELHPADGNGDTNDWTGSDGDKVNNYQLVDEVPPTGDTDYVRSDTPAEQDMYNVTDFTDTGKIVTRLWSECRARDSNASAGEIKIGFKTGGTVYLCSTDRVLTSNYARIVGDEAKVNPADSAAWEKADIDALQFVAECE